MGPLIDSHCHLDKYHARGELPQIMESAKAAGLVKMIAIGTDQKDWNLYRDLSVEHAKFIDYTVGLHPCHVEEDWEEQVQLLAPFYTEDKLPVALGEMGLDYFRLPADKEEAEIVKDRQHKAFKFQLELALQLDAPIVVHSRAAFHECVEMIDASGVDWKKVVFHCFVDGPDEVKILNDRGGRASFTGIITYKNGQVVRDAALAQGLDKLMIETDAPYLAPTPHRGKENQPAWVSHVAEYCATLFDCPLDDFCDKVTKNTQEFFQCY